MSMLINTISAIGNNTSFYPLLVRDCGIEAPTKIIQTYNQNIKESKTTAKHATRERIIDEYGTSAIWLGGIPFVEKICNKFIDKKGFSSQVSCKLLENSSAKEQQGLDINIKKFENNKSKDVIDAVNDLKNIKNNKGMFEKLTAAKYTLAVVAPVALMGFVLPKLNFALTRYLRKKDPNTTPLQAEVKTTQSELAKKESYITKNKEQISATTFSALNSFRKNSNPSFKGYASFMTGLTQQQKMAITDGGLGIGRVSTSRKKNEAIENGIKASGMLYLSFIAPKQIDKCLDKAIYKISGINPALDPKIIANKRFLSAVRADKLSLPKSQEEVIDFIDNNPKSLFSKVASEQGEVKFLKSGYRDPRYYVNTENVFNLAQKMDKFGKDARLSGDVKKYAKKALITKSASIISNIAISSALLAVGLPQLLFTVRRIFFKSEADPGLV